MEEEKKSKRIVIETDETLGKMLMELLANLNISGNIYSLPPVLLEVTSILQQLKSQIGDTDKDTSTPDNDPTRAERGPEPGS